MNMRRYFIVSLVLAILAVGLDMAAMLQYSRGGRVIVPSALLPTGERVAAKLEAQKYRSRRTFVSLVGLALALASLVFVIGSSRKGKPAWRSATYVQLIFYVLLQFSLT
jgi:hypothetical protein